MLALVAERGAGIVLMHMQGTPATMQTAPHYADVVAEVWTFLRERADTARAAGIGPDRIWLDPGLGFGKRPEDNLTLLAHLHRFTTPGFPLLIGASRKRFLAAGADDTPTRSTRSVARRRNPGGRTRRHDRPRSRCRRDPSRRRGRRRADPRGAPHLLR